MYDEYINWFKEARQGLQVLSLRVYTCHMNAGEGIYVWQGSDARAFRKGYTNTRCNK